MLLVIQHKQGIGVLFGKTSFYCSLRAWPVYFFCIFLLCVGSEPVLSCVCVCVVVWERLAWLTGCIRTDCSFLLSPYSPFNPVRFGLLARVSPYFHPPFSSYLSIRLVLNADRRQFWSQTLRVDALLTRSVGVGGVTRHCRLENKT